ncbi:Ubiquitin domain-containing protein ubfd1 [Phlyctochytrium bullatum]|nr:Ubiquitin domain-containing protein ubfd1 [Phlyctochytrium bullatum]
MLADGGAAMDEAEKTTEPQLSFKVSFQKNTHEVSLDPGASVLELKNVLTKLVGIDASLQKDSKVVAGSKITLIATQPKDILDITLAKPQAESKSTPVQEKTSLLDATEHKKVIAAGPPDDCEKPIKGTKSPIPPIGITGLRTLQGVKTRISVLLETQELQIATSERTRKVPLGSVQGIVSERIPGHEDYYAVALQLGPTVKSRLWLYWLPVQYKESLEDTILGPFRFF